MVRESSSTQFELHTCSDSLFSLCRTSYAYKRKGLRISDRPYGRQRSTYFLQLPYRFAIPLMALSGTLHWLVSQSIFLVAIDYYDSHGSPVPADSIFSEQGYKTLGFSPIAVLSAIVLGGVAVGLVIGFGFMPYTSGIPLAGSCSAAMSAACHTIDEDGIAEMKLQWGVVSADYEGFGHCAFSSGEVRRPSKGEVYC